MPFKREFLYSVAINQLLGVLSLVFGDIRFDAIKYRLIQVADSAAKGAE